MSFIIGEISLVVIGVSQLLKISRLPDATGEKQSTAVVEALQEWNIQDRIIRMCFDTTASTTGCHIGACTLMEHKEKICSTLHAATTLWSFWLELHLQ